MEWTMGLMHVGDVDAGMEGGDGNQHRLVKTSPSRVSIELILKKNDRVGCCSLRRNISERYVVTLNFVNSVKKGSNLTQDINNW